VVTGVLDSGPELDSTPLEPDGTPLERDGTPVADRATALSPHDPAHGAIAVAILGSCMTRDAFNGRFNPGYKRWYRVSASQNQPSLVSLMSPPVPIDDADLAGLGAWNAQRVRDDFERRFLADMAASPPDYLLVDFGGDIRFGVLGVDGVGGDRWVTNTRMALGRTPWYARHVAAGAPATLDILRDPDAYFERWSAALDAFVERLGREAPSAAVVIVRALHQRRLVLSGGRRILRLSDNRAVRPLDLDRLDAAWERLDEVALATPGWRSIDLRGREYPTSDAHPWGAGYLHFSPDYYPDLLAGLHQIHLERVAAARGAAPDAMAAPDGMAAFVAARAEDTRRGRSWDDEPGRGHQPPQVRRRPRFARLRLPAVRIRRRVRLVLAALGIRPRPGA
jgi:hypothetical protein